MINVRLLKNIILALSLTFISFFSLSVNALDIPDLPDAKEGIVTIDITEPDHAVGYTVGDILERSITLKIKKPYKLIEESLPIVGYEKRYKGQVLGVDLSEISHQKQEANDYTVHVINLKYQLFTNSVVAKKAALPAEFLRLINTNTKEVVRYRVPYFEIVISPLSIFGQVKIEDDMSPFRGPMLLNDKNEHQQLKYSLIAFGLSLLGLLYIIGQHAWLPRMGGPFAKCFKTIRKLPKNDSSLKIAVLQAHQAINATAGHSIFSNSINEFIAEKPNYAPVKEEIEQFFDLSRHVFFEANAKNLPDNNPQQWLINFSRRCRDCERGLVPDPLNSKV